MTPQLSARSDITGKYPGGEAGDASRIFGAHATHLRRCDLRSSLTHLSMRALRCSAAPSSWATWTPNLSPRFPSVTLVAKVIVIPKPVVNDPQGITVKQGLVTLGFREVSDVRVGKYIEVSLDVTSEHEARQRVEAMCRQLLANQIIEDFHFEIE